MPKRQLWLLEGATLAASVALILSLFCVSAIQTFIVRSGQGAAVVSAVLVDLANSDRASNMVGGLTVNPVLTAAAQAKADDMAAKGYFAHVSPDGRDSWYWFKQAGYSFSYAGENLAVDFSDSADVERAWMNSPTHHDNLLDPHFTEIGIALAWGTFEGHATTFVVQMFGTPAETAEVASIQEVATPLDATETAVATTQPAGANVLGASVDEGAQAGALTADISTTAAPPIGAVTRYAPPWGLMATSPKTMLRYAFYAIGFLVLLALLLTTGLELRWHHRRAFVTAACLLVFMSAVFVVADYAVFTEPVLADTLPGLDQ
ncbi:hypothetical protein HY971_04550 [Candidatus Kaiserbacteria bacterium]|nr:hypothetical protein [Candidatus Kaiserbacteria bacterium]